MSKKFEYRQAIALHDHKLAVLVKLVREFMGATSGAQFDKGFGNAKRLRVDALRRQLGRALSSVEARPVTRERRRVDDDGKTRPYFDLVKPSGEVVPLSKPFTPREPQPPVGAPRVNEIAVSSSGARLVRRVVRIPDELAEMEAAVAADYAS